jgi:hypothetical protein
MQAVACLMPGMLLTLRDWQSRAMHRVLCRADCCMGLVSVLATVMVFYTY